MVNIIPPSDEYREKLLATRRNPPGARRIGAAEMELMERLDQIRISQGVTQKEYAAAIGVGLAQANKYCRGQNKMPIHRFVAACAFFDISPNDVLWALDDVRTPILKDSPKRVLSLLQMFNAIDDRIKRDAIFAMVSRVYTGEVEL